MMLGSGYAHEIILNRSIWVCQRCCWLDWNSCYCAGIVCLAEIAFSRQIGLVVCAAYNNNGGSRDGCNGRPRPFGNFFKGGCCIHATFYITITKHFPRGIQSALRLQLPGASPSGPQPLTRAPPLGVLPQTTVLGVQAPDPLRRIPSSTSLNAFREASKAVLGFSFWGISHSEA